MAILGQHSQNFIQQLFVGVFNRIKKKSCCSSILDGRILKLHYKWSFYIFFFVFAVVSFSWYLSEPIICVSKFNAAVAIKDDYVNLCLSYPFLLNEVNEERIYLLFYRWIPTAMLVIACFYYIPWKLIKYGDNPRLKKLNEDMAVSSTIYDQRERNVVITVTEYLIQNLRTHNGLYFKYLFINILCLIMDISVFFGLDMLFNGRFLSYGISSLPLNRNLDEFSDYMSRTFPPFVECEISGVHEIISKRTESLGCHLIMMEVYEKLFFFIWFYLVTKITLTVFYLIFLGFLWHSYFQLCLLKIPKPPGSGNSVTDTIKRVLGYCKIGDIYLLYRFKEHCSASMFYNILIELTKVEALAALSKHPHDRKNSLSSNQKYQYDESESSDNLNYNSSTDEQSVP